MNLNNIIDAHKVIIDHIHRTPLVSSRSLGYKTEVNLFFKVEAFQKTGSFKLRGALNKLSTLSDEEKERGTITISAGNHAQGLAFASAIMGINSTVIMPQKAVKSKVIAARKYGAEVILHGTNKDLLPKMQEIQKKRNLTLVHPFDDLHMIAGHGSIGFELLEDLPEVDYIIVPVGGGGLISGIATAIKSKKSSVKVIGVEPIGAAGMYKSLQQNKVVHLDEIDTIADGLAAPFAGKHTLVHVKEFVDEVVLVSDDEIITALKQILQRCKILVEPAAAASFAAILFKKITIPKGSQVVCVLSGGNIDLSLLKEFL